MRLSRKAGLLHTHAYLDQSEYTFDDSISTTQHFITKTCSCGRAITVWEPHRRQYVAGYAATCTDYGRNSGYRCPDCRKPISGFGYINPLGHEEVTIQGYAATCTEAGLTDGKKCSRCDAITKKQEVISIDPDNHNYVSTTVEATCTEKGYTEHICSWCNDSYKNNYTPALGHNMVATGDYTDEGRIWICTTCGYTEMRT